MIFYGYNKIESLCVACKYSDLHNDICMRFPVKVKLEKRTMCGELTIKENSTYIDNEHPVMALVNTAYRLRQNWNEEWNKRIKYEKLAKKRWHEIKELKRKLGERK